MNKSFKLLFLLLWLMPAAAEEALVTRSSAHDVPTTMDRLETVVKEKGMTVFARIDHQSNAIGAGMEMPAAQVLIFGNPEVGTRLMHDDIRAGLDLPLRVLAYAAEDGTTRLVYHDPRGLMSAYDLAESPVPGKIAAALEKITGAAAE